MPGYFKLELQIEKHAQGYRLSLSRSDPRSQVELEPLLAPASFDLSELHARSRPRDYGEELTRQLFADPEVVREFTSSRARPRRPTTSCAW